MKINPILNMNFRGILDSNKAVNGKYLKYTAPLTRNTQQYGRVYNGSDVQNVSYFQYVQGLYSTYIKEDEDYRYAVTYIPLCEASELMSKANALKNSVKTVLKTCEAHRIEAKKIQQQLLDEFDEVNADMISDSDLAFKTVDIETGKITLAIPTKEDEKLFNVYEFDSSGSLDRSLKGVRYLPDGSYTAQEIHIFDMQEYACLKNAEVQNGVIDCKHAYSFDVCDMKKFSYSYLQTRKDDAVLAQYFVEYEHDKTKAYNVDVVIRPNNELSSSKRYEFDEDGQYFCAYDYEANTKNEKAKKAFFFEDNRLSTVESYCRKNPEGRLQGGHIINVRRDKNCKPKGMR